MDDELYSFLSLCVIAATIQQLLKFRQLLYLICHAVRIREELEAIITSLHAQLKSNLQSTSNVPSGLHDHISQATASHRQHMLAFI